MSTGACPRCKKAHENGVMRYWRKETKEVVFEGCPTCLLNELDELKKLKELHGASNSTICNVCKADKEFVFFAGGGQKLVCPVHTHSRGMLGRALKIMRDLVAGKELDRKEVNRLCMNIVDALGVQEEAS